MSHGANSRDLSYPEILTEAPNGEGMEDNSYRLSKKKYHIHRVVNSTLTYALSHGGYRIKYRVVWHGGNYHDQPGVGLTS